MSDLSKNVSSRSTFRDQMVGTGAPRGSRVSSLMPMTMQDKFQLAVEIENATDRITSTFESQFAPSDMRQLALGTSFDGLLFYHILIIISYYYYYPFNIQSTW